MTMVSLQIINSSNAVLASLPTGLVALFMGGTSGIGLSTLQHLAANAPPSSRIYTVARPAAVPSHDELLSRLHKSHSNATFHLIEADVSLVSEVDRVVQTIKGRGEAKLDILFMTSGFMAFAGRVDTPEGLEPSMTTRYHSRIRAVQQLAPLLTHPDAAGRVVSVLGGGLESPFVDEADLDLRDPANWSFFGAARHATTMGTLALERLAGEHPRLSVVHWFPGPVATRGLERARAYGFAPANQRGQDEAGARGLFVATSDRYAAQKGVRGLAPVSEGLAAAKPSAGDIFLVNPDCETSDNEVMLSDMRKRGMDKKVWEYTELVFASCEAKAATGHLKEEL